ncbi:efflux transporter outer membrane subunit [Maricaulaceae bacterium EIL42A08]|nr:efflux transporter outer membrane subunit [Maricaulaceae bacterium EIL42A08]
MLRRVSPFIAVICVAACTPNPSLDATAPLATPAGFTALTAETGPSASDWVVGFGDPRLSLLVAEALDANPTVLASRASLDAAEASARSSNASRLPTLDAGFGVTERDGGAQSGTSYSLGLEAAWQADIWGRLRDNARAGSLSAEAARADWYGARLSIAAATARAWYALNEAALQTELARQDVDTRSRQLEIVVRRFNRGVSRSSDVRTARSALASSQANLASREQIEAAASRTLETLLGNYPAGAITGDAGLPELDAVPNPGSPEALFERRPDLIAASARLASAGFSAEAARKALYPSLRLSGSTSDGGINLEDAFDLDGLVSSIAANLTAPIFRGGALRAERDRAAANAERLAALYVDAALTALRETENAIDADARLAVRVEALTRAVTEAEEALELVERQYASGVATIFELIDAQSRLINANAQLITARADRVDNRVALHLAIAGDFAAGGGIAPDAQ